MVALKPTAMGPPTPWLGIHLARLPRARTSLALKEGTLGSFGKLVLNFAPTQKNTIHTHTTRCTGHEKTKEMPRQFIYNCCIQKKGQLVPQLEQPPPSPSHAAFSHTLSFGSPSGPKAGPSPAPGSGQESHGKRKDMAPPGSESVLGKPYLAIEETETLVWSRVRGARVRLHLVYPIPALQGGVIESQHGLGWRGP